MTYRHKEIRICPYCERPMKVIFYSEDKPYLGKFYAIYKCGDGTCIRGKASVFGFTENNEGFVVKGFEGT